MNEGASPRPYDGGGAGRPEMRLAGPTAQAAQWYEDQGYEVLERDWHRREGEVDLIVRRGATVVFSEVVRAADRSDRGGEALLPATERRIRRLADRWLSEITPAVGRARIDVRFDVASVGVGGVEVTEGAF